MTPQSLYQDITGGSGFRRKGGLAYFDGNRFVAVPGVPGEEVFSITGDEAGNLWLSGNRGLTHLLSARHGRTFPVVRRWDAGSKRRSCCPTRAECGCRSGTTGLCRISRIGQLRASYAAARRLGKGLVPGIQLDAMGRCGPQREGGLSRIKDGHVATLTSRNGLPCDERIHGRCGTTAVRCGYMRVRPVSHRADRSWNVDRRPEAPD